MDCLLGFEEDKPKPGLRLCLQRPAGRNFGSNLRLPAGASPSVDLSFHNLRDVKDINLPCPLVGRIDANLKVAPAPPRVEVTPGSPPKVRAENKTPQCQP